jgi:hypothetical protein
MCCSWSVNMTSPDQSRSLAPDGAPQANSAENHDTMAGQTSTPGIAFDRNDVLSTTAPEPAHAVPSVYSSVDVDMTDANSRLLNEPSWSPEGRPPTHEADIMALLAATDSLLSARPRI